MLCKNNRIPIALRNLPKNKNKIIKLENNLIGVIINYPIK